jgi:hypothetical protein
MSPELTEEEMRRALFGGTPSPPPNTTPPPAKAVPEVVITPASKPATKKKAAKAFTPRLRVTLRVGNIFEGETQEITHEADTLSKLLAEQEATRLARKKFRYVEVISVKPMS